MVKEDQSRIMNSYYTLESRFKEIMEENKVIREEIRDLRKNKSHI
jgi:predicted DNA-binding protein YlxM (UPF0122 family)